MTWIEQKLSECKYAEKPTKPLMTAGTSEAVRQYAQDLEEYEEKMSDFFALKIEYAAHNFDIHQEIEARIKEESDFNSVPERYRDKVWRYAWQQGHSGGWHEVQSCLIDLIGIFV